MFKKVLLAVSGGALVLLTLLLLASFIHYAATPKPLFTMTPMPAAGIVFWWIAILGCAAAAFFISRAAVRAFTGYVPPEENEVDYKGDYDDDNEPDAE